MSVTEAELTSLVGSRVGATLFSKEGLEEEVEAKVEAVTDGMVLLRPHRSSTMRLLSVDSFLRVRLLSEGKERLNQRTMPPSRVVVVRRHLVEHHGVGLTYARQMTDEGAAIHHDALHQQPDAAELGHRHLSEEERLAEQKRASTTG